MSTSSAEIIDIFGERQSTEIIDDHQESSKITSLAEIIVDLIEGWETVDLIPLGVS